MQVLTTLTVPDWLTELIGHRHQTQSSPLLRTSRLEPHLTLIPPLTMTSHQLRQWRALCLEATRNQSVGLATVTKVEFITPSTLALMLRARVAHELQATLSERLLALELTDLPRPNHAFYPHVTVGRAKLMLTSAAQRQLRQDWSDVAGSRGIELSSLRLYTRTDDNSGYSSLGDIPLQPAGS